MYKVHLTLHTHINITSRHVWVAGLSWLCIKFELRILFRINLGGEGVVAATAKVIVQLIKFHEDCLLTQLVLSCLFILA